MNKVYICKGLAVVTIVTVTANILLRKGRTTMTKKMEVPEFLQKEKVLRVSQENEAMNESVDMLGCDYGDNEDISGAEEIDEEEDMEIDDSIPVTRSKGMTPIEKESLVRRIKGMSTEELELILDNIPTDLVMARIAKELERGKKFEQTIKNAIGDVGR